MTSAVSNGCFQFYIIMKEGFNSSGQQFHKHQEHEQLQIRFHSKRLHAIIDNL